MKKWCVTDSRLPKARIFWVAWHWWWFRHFTSSAGLGRRYWPHLWLAVRGSNFWQAWVGPLHFGWRRPWLSGPAETYLQQHYGVEK